MSEALQTPPSSITRIGGRLCLMPYPIVAQVPVVDGTLLILRCPVGVAQPLSLVKVGDDGSIKWTAEPCAWPPQHDPYVEAWLEDDQIRARSALGWVIALDNATGTGQLILQDVPA